MNLIRYTAVFLMSLTSVLHFIYVLNNPSDSNVVPTLIFGVIYFIVGILLLFRLKYSLIFGILFPIVGLLVGFFVLGIKNWSTAHSFMFLIDAVVIVCCLLLLLKKEHN